MTDNDDVLRQARESVPDVHMDTPVETIMARGADRRRRRRRLTQASVAGTAAAAAAAVALVGVLGSATPARAKDSIRTAAFTLVSNSNGTDSLTLSLGQMFNPATLQQALTQDGIPALVKIGEFCSSDPAPAHGQVVSVQLPDGQPVGKSTPGNAQPVPPDAVNVINPAAIPAGDEVVFSFMNNDRDLMLSVVNQGSYTCSSTPPAPGGGSGNSGSGNSGSGNS